MEMTILDSISTVVVIMYAVVEETANYGSYTTDTVNFTVSQGVQTEDAIPAVITDSATTAVESLSVLSFAAAADQEYVIVKGTEVPDWNDAVSPQNGEISIYGLSAGAIYTIYTRKAETINTAAGDAVSTSFVTRVSAYGYTCDAGDPGLVGATVYSDFDAEEALTYKWYSCDDANGTSESAIAGETAQNYIVSDSIEGKYFYAKAFINGIQVASFDPVGPVSKGTVTFESSSGSAVDPIEDLSFGDKLTKPADPTQDGYYFGGWFKDKELTEAWNFDSDTVSFVSTALYAKWSAVPLHTVEGTVYNSSGAALSQAAVSLKKNDTVIGIAVTDGDGKFSFSAAAGTYSIIAEYNDGINDITKTELIELTDDMSVRIDMPPAEKRSVIDNSEAGQYAPQVGGLDDIAAAENLNPGETVTIALSVVSEENAGNMSPAEQAEFETGKNAITGLTTGKTLVFLNIRLQKTLSDGSSANVTDIGGTNDKLLTIVIPFDTANKNNLVVYRYHGTTAAAMTKDPAAGEEGYVIGNGQITVYAKLFSVYAIGYDTPSPGGGSSGGGGSAPAKTATPEAVSAGFDDVKQTDYFAKAVEWAVAKGITTGTDAKHFSPLMSCTRAQTVTFLWRAAGSPEPKATGCAFTDIPADAYYYKAVLWAVENGITLGKADTAFAPDDTVTRGQTVTFLMRALKGKADGNNPFSDVKSDMFCYDAVLWAAENGITSGISANIFGPDNSCVRAQIVTFLFRAYSE